MDREQRTDCRDSQQNTRVVPLSRVEVESKHPSHWALDPVDGRSRSGAGNLECESQGGSSRFVSCGAQGRCREDDSKCGAQSEQEDVVGHSQGTAL